jgi:acyl dehydratase
VLVEQTGLAFEDMKEGETFIHWPGRAITFEESRLHALRSLEINPRWHDEAYLKKHQAITPAVFEPLVRALDRSVRGASGGYSSSRVGGPTGRVVPSRSM